ncbi:MAG: PEP/pyruvate-binding domain-containing protein [Aquabacterium sp.]
MRAPAHPLFLIGCGTTSQDASAQTLGFKAWNLLQMADMGLPVPPCLVLGTPWCQDATSRAAAAQPETWRAALSALERRTGLQLGHRRRPLLLSVRSGAAVSMPGMMETLLNVGLCDATVPGLLSRTGNPRLVWDAYRRLVATFGEVVGGLDPHLFEAQTEALAGARPTQDLDFTELRTLTQSHLALYREQLGTPFPQDPEAQLAQAISAVLRSWDAPKAASYRAAHGIADDIGTAVTLQTMVFGNAGGRSGAGVGFTRNPSTGEPGLWVDFLFNAQGEDVVSGRQSAHGHARLAAILPLAWQQLCDATARLEDSLRDMQDFEFTVQDGELWMLQTRSGKRSPLATARIALDMLDEGRITAQEAASRTAHLTEAMLQSTRVVGQAGAPLNPLACGVAASPGVVIGEIALDEARVQARQHAGVDLILVRPEADTSDIATLQQAGGLLTQRGARTSHAAVVARQLGKACVVGCGDLRIDLATRSVTLGAQRLAEGDVLTLDGHTGRVYVGAARTEVEVPHALLERLQALRSQGA